MGSIAFYTIMWTLARTGATAFMQLDMENSVYFARAKCKSAVKSVSFAEIKKKNDHSAAQMQLRRQKSSVIRSFTCTFAVP